MCYTCIGSPIAPTDEPDDKGTSAVAIIAGSVVGAVAIVVIIIGCIIFCGLCCKRNKTSYIY